MAGLVQGKPHHKRMVNNKGNNVAIEVLNRHGKDGLALGSLVLQDLPNIHKDVRIEEPSCSDSAPEGGF